MEPIEALEEELEKIEADVPLTIYIWQRLPLANRGGVEPLEVRRDLDLLPQVVAHLKKEGAESGTFELKLRGPKKRHYGSATLPITLPPRSHSDPKRSEGEPSGSAADPARILTDPTRPQPSLARLIEERIQERIASQVEAVLSDDEEEEDEEEEDEEEETAEGEEETAEEGGGFWGKVINHLGAERTAGFLEQVSGGLAESLKDLLDASVATQRAKATYWQSRAGTARPTATPKVRLVKETPAAPKKPDDGSNNGTPNAAHG